MPALAAAAALHEEFGAAHVIAQGSATLYRNDDGDSDEFMPEIPDETRMDKLTKLPL